jgi:hypothetical protein
LTLRSPARPPATGLLRTGPGYTVIPHSSSMTSPPPRVAARPVPPARAGLRPVAKVFLGRPEGLAARRGASCGESVGILKIAAGACLMGLSLFLRLCRRELTTAALDAPRPRLERGTYRLGGGAGTSRCYRSESLRQRVPAGQQPPSRRARQTEPGQFRRPPPRPRPDRSAMQPQPACEEQGPRPHQCSPSPLGAQGP